MKKHGAISTTEFWFKVVGFLQQNWALVEPEKGRFRIYFFDDASKIFDHIDYETFSEAQEGLVRNGFECYDDAKGHDHIIKPTGEFSMGNHPQGKIYSGGVYWR